jgi:Mg2+ and Co2+ transporter CorA
MIMIHKFSNKNNTWIDLNNPTLNDLSFLKKEIFLDDKVLNLILKKTLRNVVYNFENYVFFVFYLPV